MGQATTAVDSANTCNYRLCALTIVPAWNGLRVVRGTSGAGVANLNFFFPRDISHALEPDGRRGIGRDSVVSAAQRAVRLRRVGAVFTDLGLTAMTAAGVRALGSDSNKRTNGVLGATGLALLGVAVPLQFAADGALSKAVWWYNLRYGEREEASQ